MLGFEPRILAFACNWCSYAGADLAGTSRKSYPHNIRTIRVMCTGRIEPAFILAGFEKGADGVAVLGCHIGDCHYISGNVKAQDMVAYTLKLMDTLGIERERLMLEWVSASEGQRFAEVVTGFTEAVRSLGPLDLDGSLGDGGLGDITGLERAECTPGDGECGSCRMAGPGEKGGGGPE